jgi:hypothetical protein
MDVDFIHVARDMVQWLAFAIMSAKLCSVEGKELFCAAEKLSASPDSLFIRQTH